MTVPNYEIPAQFREIAEAGVEQARAAFEGFLAASQKAATEAEGATTSIQTSAKDARSKAIGFAQTNVKAAFDHTQKLIQLKDPKEFLSVQSEFLKTQVATAQDQAKQLGEAVMKVVTRSK